MNTIKFKKWECFVDMTGRYDTGIRAIDLVEKDTGDLIARATVNIPGEFVPSGHVLIKNWGENEGVKEALMNAGVIGPEVNSVPAGYVRATLHKLLI